MPLKYSPVPGSPLAAATACCCCCCCCKGRAKVAANAANGRLRSSTGWPAGAPLVAVATAGQMGGRSLLESLLLVLSASSKGSGTICTCLCGWLAPAAARVQGQSALMNGNVFKMWLAAACKAVAVLT